MSKHDRGFPEPTPWNDDSEPEEEPELVECDSCGKDFEPDTENWRNGLSRWGGCMAICNHCLRRGWPFGREYERE